MQNGDHHPPVPGDPEIPCCCCSCRHCVWYRQLLDHGLCWGSRDMTIGQQYLASVTNETPGLTKRKLQFIVVSSPARQGPFQLISLCRGVLMGEEVHGVISKIDCLTNFCPFFPSTTTPRVGWWDLIQLMIMIRNGNLVATDPSSSSQMMVCCDFSKVVHMLYYYHRRASS